MSEGYRARLAAFENTRQGGWSALPFFKDGTAQRLAAALDAKTAAGANILPSPTDLLNALDFTPLIQVRLVILGQDPYPTPGDAHGLAFSVNKARAIPRSLNNIFKEMEADVGVSRPCNGNLTRWAKQGVLLLNTCLTVEAGAAGSHRGLGWEALTDQMIQTVSEHQKAAVFILWGADAHKKRALIDETKHYVLASAHPSPLSARRGFFGSKPFSQANAWLESKGLPKVNWMLN